MNIDAFITKFRPCESLALGSFILFIRAPRARVTSNSNSARGLGYDLFALNYLNFDSRTRFSSSTFFFPLSQIHLGSVSS